MKIKKYLLLGVSMIVLASCGGESEEANEESEEGMGTMSAESDNDDSTENQETNSTNPSHDSGLLDLSDTESGWINYEGEQASSSEYLMTSPVEYDPNSQYEISVGAYISYLNGDEFLETIQQSSSGLIEQVEEADTIRVSYHNSFLDRISLKEENN